MEQVQRTFKLTNLIGQFDWSRHVSIFHHVFFFFFLSLFYGVTELGQLPPEAIFVVVIGARFLIGGPFFSQL